MGGNSSVKDCFSTEAITSTSKSTGQVGGIAGCMEVSATVENCYSTGAISGYSSVGGVVGQILSANATIKNCVALNPSLTATRTSGTANVGYVAALSKTPTYEGNYYLSTMERIKSGSASLAFGTVNTNIGKSIAAGGLIPTFWTGTVGWSEEIWSFANDAYPQLKGFAE
jgi:hypothetical protein